MAVEFDIGVVGSSPLAFVLAGLLARDHAKRVVLIGEIPSPLRIDRGLDLSVAPVTRPETWLLLEQTVPETARLLGQIGRGLVARVTLAMLAEHPASAAALQHVHNMATGYGLAAERLATGPGEPLAVSFRDVRLLRRAAFNGTIGPWLDALGVRRISPRLREIVLRRDGSLTLAGAQAVTTQLGILADDEAILSHVEVGERDPLLAEAEALAVLTAPVRRMPQHVALHLDRGVTLRQHGSRAVSALAIGDPGTAPRRIAQSLPAGTTRRAGEAVFRVLRSADGAPLVGRMRGGAALMLAGLGPTGLFQAPALARLVAGRASEAERAYFAARAPGRGGDRRLVAEFAPGAADEVPA